MVQKRLYLKIIYEGVQENIVILNVTIFCVQIKECCNIKFCCPVITPLRVKGLYFFSSSSRSKENTDFKKYLVNVSHKFSKF